MNATLAGLLLYVVLITVVGLAIGRRVSGTRDFFVAGRALGPGLLFATLLAANIGAGSTVNAAGLGYQNGIAAWWWVGSAGIGTLVLAFWLGPRMWRVPGSTRCAPSATTWNSATVPRCGLPWRRCSGSARWPSSRDS